MKPDREAVKAGLVKYAAQNIGTRLGVLLTDARAVIVELEKEAASRSRAGLARASDPETSKAAPAADFKLEGIRLEVLEYLERLKDTGATDHEITQRFDPASESTYRKRRTELVDMGLAVDSGLRRPGPTNKLMVVWVHHKFGPDADKHGE